MSLISTSNLFDLPTELLLLAISFLDSKGRKACRSTCSFLRTLINDSVQSICIVNTPDLQQLLKFDMMFPHLKLIKMYQMDGYGGVNFKVVIPVHEGTMTLAAISGRCIPKESLLAELVCYDLPGLTDLTIDDCDVDEDTFIRCLWNFLAYRCSSFRMYCTAICHYPKLPMPPCMKQLQFAGGDALQWKNVEQLPELKSLKIVQGSSNTFKAKMPMLEVYEGPLSALWNCTSRVLKNVEAHSGDPPPLKVFERFLAKNAQLSKFYVEIRLQREQLRHSSPRLDTADVDQLVGSFPDIEIKMTIKSVSSRYPWELLN